MNRATSDRRLLKLADFLDALPPKRFDYSTWVGNEWQGAPDLSCGTTACALGWATTMPEFRRLGLRLFPPGGGVGAYPHLRRPGYAAIGTETAEVLFGLDYQEAEYLFLPTAVTTPCWLKRPRPTPSPRATPARVAAHIRYFVEQRRRANLNG